MDTEQTKVSPAEKMEEPQEVSALCNQGGIAARPRSKSMVEDEQVAVNHEKRGSYSDEPSMVQAAGFDISP